MTKSIYKDIEELLIGKHWILMDLRYGDGLKKDKADMLLIKVELLENTETIPKSFFDLIIDSIVVITSSFDTNEDKTEY
ncbi:hypothetical protein [Aequorivita antarctica]|uniref:Uncharacterized protein n=1 Tax=Aequorivita antarctica TaxID=153266 RepID=A0A5C6YWW2_9FLAO|nr:hypothetical protein [Aequorivita antarctica]TXD71573.1 hypothetical protein ESU54_16250 [Aequorivita antarctica]SRX75284.1 hypothetical protein AEQU3_02278 [Aequorivita antarctica]